MTKRAIVTAAGPNMQPLLQQFTLPPMKRFAHVHGYELVVNELLEDGATWHDSRSDAVRLGKPRLLLDCLRQGYQAVVWIDADALVLRDDRDIMDDLPPDCFQALALEHLPTRHCINPNTGVWPIRNCGAARDFLEAVLQNGPVPGSTWGDQAAVMKMLGWHLGNPQERHCGARPGLGNEYTLATGWLSLQWNQLYVYEENKERFAGSPVVPDPRILHFSGMSNGERARLMEMVISSR